MRGKPLGNVKAPLAMRIVFEMNNFPSNNVFLVVLVMSNYPCRPNALAVCHWVLLEGGAVLVQCCLENLVLAQKRRKFA